MMGLWMAAAAFAGNVYVNGTFVEPRSIAGVSFEKVTVTFDDSGNVLIDAPGYKIEVVDPPGATATPPPPRAPSGAAAPTMGAPGPRAATTPPAGPSAVAPARWWLVTEDNGSTGHTIEIWANGQLAQTVRSGSPQQIIDIGKWLKLGANEISVRSTSVNASGGTFYVYLGTGSDQSGTVVMDNPQVQFGVGNTRTGPYERNYTVNVDR